MKTDAAPLVIGMGALNADRILRVERLLADGEAAVEDGGTFAGGSAANTIYGLAKLGVPSGFCGAVGSDSEGKLLLRDFKKAGVDTSHISTKKGQSSGTVFCISTPKKRALYVLPGANGLLEASDIDMDYVNRAGYLHLSSFVGFGQFGLSLETVQKLSPRVKFSFAPGSLYIPRGIKALKPFFKRTDVLFLNREEIEAITADDFRPGTRVCLAAGCRSVVVTLGKGFKQNGKMVVAYVRDPRGEWYIEAGQPAEAEVIDTTGAGDAFAAGFLFGLIEDKDPPTCGKLGNCMARLSLRCSGARGGLPTRRQLERLFSDLYGNT
jgi:ribokinase